MQEMKRKIKDRYRVVAQAKWCVKKTNYLKSNYINIMKSAYELTQFIHSVELEVRKAA